MYIQAYKVESIKRQRIVTTDKRSEVTTDKRREVTTDKRTMTVDSRHELTDVRIFIQRFGAVNEFAVIV